MNSIITLISKYKIATYFILTFIISWGAIQLLIGFENLPLTGDQVPIIGMALLLGPFFSSLILTILINGKHDLANLLSGFTRWRVNSRWYIFVLLIAPLSSLLVLSGLSIFSPNYSAVFMSNGFTVNIIIIGIISGLMVAFFEEFGWTGFAVPALLDKNSFLKTGFIVGIVWGIWHLPPFLNENSFSSSVAFVILLAQLFSWLPAFRILMIWAYQKTESLMLIVLMHTSLVFSMMVIEPQLEGSSLLSFIIVKALLLWIIVFIVKKFDFKKL